MKKIKELIIVIILLISFTTVIYFVFNNEKKADNVDDNKIPIKREEIKLTSENLKILVERAYEENLEEIKLQGEDYKKVQKILYSKVIKESKGKASPSDIKVMINVVYTEKNELKN